MEANSDTVWNSARALVENASIALSRAGVENPGLDAELLLAAALNVDRVKLLTGSLALNDRAVRCFHAFVARRAMREPVAYIIGRKEFFSLEFEVNREVLIPRPETELAVATALGALTETRGATLLDLGTGSGAIAIAIAVNDPAARIVATDISQQALNVARRNAERLGCSHQIEFRLGDCWEAIGAADGSHPQFDLIVSNPPYVAQPQIARLEPEVGRFEPEIALAGGEDGLEFYRRIAQGFKAHLKRGGELIMEVGAGQASRVADLFAGMGCAIVQVIPDLAGHQRVMHLRRQPC